MVLAVWILALVVITLVGQGVGGRFLDKFGPDPTQNVLQQRFPTEAGDNANVVFHTTTPVTSAANRATIDRLVSELQPLPNVSQVRSPFTQGGSARIAPDGRIAFAVVQFSTTTASIPKSSVQRVMDTAQSFRAPGFQVELGGPPIEKVVSSGPGSSEVIGITAAVIIMLIAFGSVVAMGLPLITALFGIVIGVALVDLMSHALVVPTFGTQLAAMIGIGVGIDYALLIVTRYRQGLFEGREPREAVTTALATSGRAVLFAGSTVVISLVGLFLFRLPFMNGLAFGTIAAVLLVMIAALTLLPAVLGFAGRAIDRLAAPRLLRRGTPRSQGFWYRWSRMIQRRPWVAGGISLAVLMALVVPLFSMHLAFTDAGNDPANLTTRKAYDLLAQGFGPGFNGPLVVVAETSGPADRPVVQALSSDLATTRGVAFVAPPQFNASADAAVITVDPTTSPQAVQTEQLVQHIRDDVVPRAVSASDVKVLVGGQTAGSIDASSYLSGRLPWVIAGVLVLSFLLLMAVFRSVAIPLKAAVMNLLSIGAAYGVIVAVFQWGWAGSIIGVDKTGPIDPWIPVFMFTILFGLSMDYEVFLLSRVREEWRRSGDNATAVADGLAKTGRVITAAAAIMVCVFGSFVINDPFRVLKVFGLGLAASIFIDATLVRMVLVPSVMEILGRANWWMPRWLDRRVPRLGAEVDVEEVMPPVPGLAELDASKPAPEMADAR
ncbi:MAG TPA: MMPL family transporter [Acidimicrobiales bacterium]|nr:MMPL family transporter [Acidimicrobiales bacterium]